jgi:C-terminal processing protease CtpA/Prc
MSGLSLGWTGEHIVVSEVYPDTPASAAELRAGDRIVSLEGRAPASLWAVQCALKAGPGRVVRLGVERDGAGFEVRFTLRRLV